MRPMGKVTMMAVEALAQTVNLRVLISHTGKSFESGHPASDFS